MKKSTVLIVLLVVSTCFAWGTTVRPMSVERLTKLATAVVEAHVTQTWSEWDAQHTRIYTYTRLSVSRTLKGTQTDTVLVKQAGGVKDGRIERVFGVRHFRAGEDVVLFLEPGNDGDGAMRVVGLMQGNFLTYKTATGETKVSNGVPNVTAVSTDGRMSPYTGSHMSLQELESQVSRASASKAVVQ